MQNLKLSNGIDIPPIVMGTSICDLKGNRKRLQSQMAEALSYAVDHGVYGFDTAQDYDNESLLGNFFKHLIAENRITREELFITTKVGNSQQLRGNMFDEIDQSLKSLDLDYIDLWLLHWPYPQIYIDNWKQLCKIYQSGKVKAIGIANCRPRHLHELENSHVDILPHAIQIEYHPFRTVPEMVDMCKHRNIQIEAYSANCLMLPFVRNNSLLQELSHKYNKSVTQIMMRWHVQQGVVPIFRSMNPSHIKENISIDDFEIEEGDMQKIYSLNMNYKFHPESLNCPGY